MTDMVRAVFTSPIINGKPFSYDQRSLPYVEDPSQYHRNRVVGDLSNLEELVKNCKDKDLVDIIDGYVQTRYGGNYKDVIAFSGKIAPVDGWGIGGGIQYELPLPVEWLERLGILKEIK